MTTQHCIAESELQEYALGQLSDERSEHIVQHLVDCPDCETVVATLDAASDTLLDVLRSAQCGSATPPEAGYAEALANVRDLAIIGQFQKRSTDQAAETRDELAIDVRDYRLISKLGTGGMSSVFRAVHTRLNRTVALKLLPAERMRDSQSVARFNREMKAVGQLDHPAIVQATDAGEIDGTWFLAMELIDGCNLARISDASGPLPVADACELVRQAAVGLQYVHEQGMVHRDIKPSNLMLTKNGQVKILDLGLALLDGMHGTVDELTTVGQLMGTLDYMAPEQGDNSHDVDIRVDVYSLGATLYKLLTAKAPYSGPGVCSPLQKLKLLATEDVPPVRSQNADVPAELADVVHRMLAREPDERFATPAEVAAALESFVAGSQLELRLQQTQAHSDDLLQESAISSRHSLAQFGLTQSPGPAEASTSLRTHETLTAPSRGRVGTTLKLLLSLVGVALIAWGGFSIFIRTGSGNIVIESTAPDVDLVVTRAGKFYKEIQVTQGSQATVIGAGDYEVTVKGGSDRLQIAGGTFTLYRGKTQVVQITEQTAQADNDLPRQADDPILTHLQRKLVEVQIDLNAARGIYSTEHPKVRELENTLSHYRQEIARLQGGKQGTTESIPADAVRYEGKTFQEWLAELQTERSAARLETAVAALVAIGESDHQTQIAQALLDAIARRNFELTLPTPSASDAGFRLYFAAHNGFLRIRMSADDAMKILGEAFEHSSAHGRYFAAQVLDEFLKEQSPAEYRVAAPAVIPQLLAASRDKHPAVRLVILETLYTVGHSDPRVVARMTEALQDTQSVPYGKTTRSVTLGAARLLSLSQPHLELLIPRLVTIGSRPNIDRYQLQVVVDSLLNVGQVQPQARTRLTELLAAQLKRGHEANADRLDLILNTLRVLGPSALSAVPTLESLYSWQDIDPAQAPLIDDVLQNITRKAQPQRRSGHTLPEWCQQLVDNRDVQQRMQIIDSISRFTYVDPPERRGRSSRRSTRELQPDEIKIIAQSCLRVMREHDWRTYKESPEWTLKYEMLALLHKISPLQMEPWLIDELNGENTNGKLFVLSYYYPAFMFQHRGNLGNPLREHFVKSVILANTLLKNAQSDKSPEVRSRALWLVLEIFPVWDEQPAGLAARILQTLQQSVNDSSPLVARIATIGVCPYAHVPLQLPDANKTMQSAVLRLFQSSDPREKLVGIELIPNLPAEIGVPLLVEIIRDQTPAVRVPHVAYPTLPFDAPPPPRPQDEFDAGRGLMGPARQTKTQSPQTHLSAAIDGLRSFGKQARETDAVPALRHLIATDRELATTAAAALKRIKPPALYDGEPFDEWKTKLSDKKPERLVEVLTAIGILAAEDDEHAAQAVSLITKTALAHWSSSNLGGDGPGQVRSSAVTAFRRLLGSQDGTDQLVTLLSTDESQSQQFGLAVLQGASRPPKIPLPKNWDRQSVVGALVEATRGTWANGSANAMTSLMTAIVQLDPQDKRLSARLIELLEDADPVILKLVIRVLTEVAPDSPQLHERLIAFTQHSNIALRAQSVFALGQVRLTTKPAIQTLIKIVQSDDPELRKQVTVSHYFDEAAKLKTTRFWQDLSLSQYVVYPSIRQLALLALGNIGEPAKAVVPVLIGMTTEEPALQPREIVALFVALAEMGPAARPALPIMQQYLNAARDSEVSGQGELEKVRAAMRKLSKP